MVEYFDSEGNALTPSATTTKAGIPTDCNIRSFTIHLGTLTAPANAAGEGVGSFSGTLQDLVKKEGLRLGDSENIILDKSFKVMDGFTARLNTPTIKTLSIQSDGKIIA